MEYIKHIKHLFASFLFFYIVNSALAVTGAKYLIITPDNYVSTLQPLAEWKTKKGILTKIAPLSITGSSASQIKNYITNAYNAWDIRPDYVLLAGASSLIPASGNSDDYYADMTGSLRIELSVGRFPATTINQMQNLVSKVIAYEQNPYMTDSLWYLKGTLVIREDGSTPPDDVFWENARYIYSLWRNTGYTQIDSFSRLRGNNSTDVTNAINNGRNFVVYRGEAVSNWWSPFAMTPSSLNNGVKLPIVVSGTCQTMSLSNNDYLGNQFVNAGSATDPKGAIAFFGTTVVASGSNLALNRGTVSKGFFQAIFSERVWQLGDAAKRAKYLIDSIQPPNYTTTRYSEWELFGDPAMQIWTATPQRFTVTHDSVIINQSQTFNVSVRQGSIPVSALVCIRMDSTIYQSVLTNGSGIAVFNINPLVPGTMSVTVSAHDFIPYQGNVRIRSGSYAHDLAVVSIIEPSGNIAAGANITPSVKVKNNGASVDTFTTTVIIGSVYNQTDSMQILSPGDSNIIPLPNWVAISGEYPVTAFINSVNDQYRGNDTLYGYVNVVTANDVGVDAILAPDSSVLLNQTVIPKARIKNFGSANQMNFAVTCSIIGDNNQLRYANIQNISSLASGDTIIVNFSGWVANTAEVCQVITRTILPGDQNAVNDSKIKTTNVVMMMIEEGFNNSSFPPANWQAITISGQQNWEWTSAGTYPTCTPYEGNGMITYQSWIASSGSSARLITPMISVSGVMRCSLKFMMMHDQGYASYNDRVQIQTSTNGTVFTTVETFNRYSGNDGWTEHSVYLGQFTNNFYIAFNAVSAYGNNMYLDYVRMFSPNAIEENEINTLPNSIVTILSALKPNPVSNSFVNLSFNLGETAPVLLRIYDASGKLVKILVDQTMNAGEHSVNWNCQDYANQRVVNGIYFCSLETPKTKLTKKLILTR